MAKRTWQDRIVERPRTFNVQENPDGTITLIPSPGQVIQEGTPINATNLNGIEMDIELTKLYTDIKGSTQIPTYSNEGEIIKIDHKIGNLSARVDTFVYNENSIKEERVLSNGASIKLTHMFNYGEYVRTEVE